MATRNAEDRFSIDAFVGHSFVTRPTRLAVLRGMYHTMIVNRGKNTGAGAAYVYWASPNGVDATGLFYTSTVPWVQITDVVGVGTYNS